MTATWFWGEVLLWLAAWLVTLYIGFRLGLVVAERRQVRRHLRYLDTAHRRNSAHRSTSGTSSLTRTPWRIS